MYQKCEIKNPRKNLKFLASGFYVNDELKINNSRNIFRAKCKALLSPESKTKFNVSKHGFIVLVNGEKQ